jgi:uncharacterized protein YjbI with pentapeptide repeats
MANKTRKNAKPLVISSPDLPDESTAESDFGEQLNSGDHYTDIVLSNRNLAGQAAGRLTLQRARLQDIEMVGSKLKFLRLIDARLDHCDLANIDWSQSTFDRIELVNCRMTGGSFIDSEIKDVSFEDCKIDLAQFRVSAFKDCRFLNCNLREADFYEANLEGIVFSGCDMRGVQLYGANLKGADFRGSQLEGLQARAEDLQGAIIDSLQLLDLTRDLAGMVGLKVLEPDQAGRND